jgi:hypothetical protein
MGIAIMLGTHGKEFATVIYCFKPRCNIYNCEFIESF